MSRILFYCFFFVFILFFQHVFAAEKYNIDTHHSYVLWRISHFGFSSPSGKWAAEGIILFDETQPQNSSVQATIPLAAIVTGNPELDEHLKAKLFFDTAKYPKALFKSQKITILSKNTATIAGILTLHGVSKPIVLQVTFNRMGNNPISNKKTIGFSATARLKRSDFGIDALLPGLGDEVTLMIEVEAYQANT